MPIPRFAVLAVLIVSTSAFGQDDDDDQPPGLRTQYSVGESAVERVDPDIAFQWAEATPDDRLPPGKFAARWSGTLLLRSEGNYRFHAFVQGRVLLKVNGRTVLEGTAEKPQWIGGSEPPLKFGDQPFELEFARTGDAALLKLYWSSTEFPLEPVPYHSLFQSKGSPDLTKIERGRVQFDAFRCGNCHSGPQNGERLEAPSLKHVGTGTQHVWLVEKLMRPGPGTRPETAGEKMPHFGFARDDAEAIISTLLAKAAPVEMIAAPKLKESERAKDLQAGTTLIRSVGCLACHTWNSLGEPAPFGGGSLEGLAAKRTAEWLTTWLAEPGRLNPRHRMPVFALAEKERLQIVLALSAATNPKSEPAVTKASAADETVLARGARLIEASRCAMCHELPGTKPVPQPVKSLADSRVDWDRGCQLPPDRTRNRPGFPEIDAKAIRAYVSSWKADGTYAASRSSATPFLFGRQLLERKNCIACHDRDDVRGISKHAAAIAKADETLTGSHMTLIPPRLNGVGDRMHDAGLAVAIRGEQKTPRLNWLRVRMPKFSHSPADQAALLNYLIGHDRIPDGGPHEEVLSQRSAGGKAADPQTILAGRELLGSKGFSCIACHAVKDYTPKVTALGTRGSNLHLIGQRMRTEYFFRWTRAPLRVMPGIEMPNYQRPHEFILPGQLDEQLIAIWQALNDPNLTAPTNAAAVEQLLAVGERDRPRVVRDVFTVPGSDGETVARAYAAGLRGGHSVLFDLDTFGIRGWTLGEFARQRCEGKRWYWDLAGTTLAAQFDKRPDIVLVDKKTGELVSPETGWEFAGRLESDRKNDDSAGFDYVISYTRNGVTHSLDVVEEMRAIARNGETGWERSVRTSASKTGSVWPWLRNTAPEFLHDRARVVVADAHPNSIEGLPKSAVRFSPDPRHGDPVISARIEYMTALRWQDSPRNLPTLLVSRAEPVTSVPGFEGRRLPLPRSIMPTAIAWDSRRRLLFTSLKGHLYRLQDSAAGPSLLPIEEGLAASFGIIEHRFPNSKADDSGSDLVVAHKPELLRLTVDDGGIVRRRSVVATGWGVTDDYHDWTCGIVKDSTGNLYFGLGSDYTFKNRPVSKSRWRGHILRVEPNGQIESIASGLRYPTGLTVDDRDRLFVSDQQGVQNTFNELNFIRVGHRYGVPSRHETEPNAPADPPAVQIPHPWTRSVNGIAWIPKSHAELAPIAGQILGCEFNNNALVRMSLQTVGDSVQGAVYPFSKPSKEGDTSNFVGPLCIGIGPNGAIYVGSLQDGGWAGGLNMGDIVELMPTGVLPNGIREIRATASGFDLEFFHPVDPGLAVRTDQYKVSGYTRAWKGDYATPDSGHHSGDVTSAAIGRDGRTVSLTVAGRKPGHVYDISVGEIGTESQRALWPAVGHYTLHRIPD